VCERPVVCLIERDVLLEKYLYATYRMEETHLRPKHENRFPHISHQIRGSFAGNDL